ncbi:rCG63458 [Rattus norvegicus]|uniref:RCG63458 n=1 Tax=Rattus norvegicus TaxID=10116 RepID=A6HCA6_RAT|nr:rCG63458 [Rattus norvegicus]
MRKSEHLWLLFSRNMKIILESTLWYQGVGRSWLL